jgi:hypothetical protein
MRLALAFVAALAAAGCSRLVDPAGRAGKRYPDGVDGLRAFAGDILEAARKDERQQVHDLLATTILTDAELATLLGPTAKTIVPRYQQLMGTLVNRGGVELVAQVYERKLDTVEVLPVDPGIAEQQTLGPLDAATAADRAFLRALTTPTPLYSIRLKRKGDDRGLRYDLFFYIGGRWATANQLGKYL